MAQQSGSQATALMRRGNGDIEEMRLVEHPHQHRKPQ